MKHTPGPWQIYGSHISTIGRDKDIVPIAKTLPASAFGMAETQEANARLIAAAPEMLEALQEIYAQCWRHSDSEGQEPCRPTTAIPKVREAIRKATQS